MCTFIYGDKGHLSLKHYRFTYVTIHRLSAFPDLGALFISNYQSKDPLGNRVFTEYRMITTPWIYNTKFQGMRRPEMFMNYIYTCRVLCCFIDTAADIQIKMPLIHIKILRLHLNFVWNHDYSNFLRTSFIIPLYHRLKSIDTSIQMFQ